MSFIKVIAKENSAFETGKELFCGSSSFYNKKRISYEEYIRNKKFFYVVGVDKTSGEIIRDTVTEDNVHIILPDELERNEYKIIKKLIEEKILDNLCKIRTFGSDLDSTFEKQKILDENLRLKQIVKKLEIYE